jgi:hypothetical protein
VDVCKSFEHNAAAIKITLGRKASEKCGKKVKKQNVLY